MERREQNENEIELEKAYEALKRLRRREPTSFNGLGWDGDSSNEFGYGCVEDKIIAEINELENLIWLDSFTKKDFSPAELSERAYIAYENSDYIFFIRDGIFWCEYALEDGEKKEIGTIQDVEAFLLEN